MIDFSKYHGCGNSFVIMEEKNAEELKCPDYSALAVKVCDVNTGVGADGFIIVREKPELEMVFYNMDGSRAPMCGNGIRCFAHFCREKGIEKEALYNVKTLAGDMVVEVTNEDPFRVRINMGKPVFSPQSISVESQEKDYLKKLLPLVQGGDVEVNSLFMGTVHTVVFVESLQNTDMNGLGKEICEHPVYKEKTNVNFVEVVDENTLKMQTYERGVGMTLACGTGACASVVVANMQGLCGRKTEVKLELGSLMIELGEDGNVYMEGPSVKVLNGEL